MYKKYLKFKSKYQLAIRDNIQIKQRPYNEGNDKCKNVECTICLFPHDSAGQETVQIECGCCFHEECLIGYIRSTLTDRTMIKEDGIKCPFSNEHVRISAKKIQQFLRPDGLTLEPHAKFNETLNLSDEELEKLNEYQERAIFKKVEIVSRGNMIDGTSKPCPKCSILISHYHGHACHHMTCPNCDEDYCWRCGSTAEENLRDRQNRASCKCPGNFWSTFCSNEHILENIVLNEFGYPIDKRCGCPICNECFQGKICPACTGNCVVCKEIVPQGPTDETKSHRYIDEMNANILQILGYYVENQDDKGEITTICCINIITQIKYEFSLSNTVAFSNQNIHIDAVCIIRKVDDFKKDFDFIPIHDLYFEFDNTSKKFNTPYFNINNNDYHIEREVFIPISEHVAPTAMSATSSDVITQLHVNIMRDIQDWGFKFYFQGTTRITRYTRDNQIIIQNAFLKGLDMVDIEHTVLYGASAGRKQTHTINFNTFIIRNKTTNALYILVPFIRRQIRNEIRKQHIQDGVWSDSNEEDDDEGGGGAIIMRRL